MELVTRTRQISDSCIELLIVWTDLFDATESSKFKVTKLEEGFRVELVGGMADTITLVGPKAIVVTKESA